MEGAYFVYVGAYTRDKSEGIRVYRMDAETGRMEFASIAPGIRNPSFLALHPDRPLLYAANELSEWEGRSGGGVSAFAIDPQTGGLTLLNHQFSQGECPCYVSVDRTGQCVLAANYSSGSVCVFPLNKDGRLGEASDVSQHRGSSVNPHRQEGPHAHSFGPGPDNRFAFSADLGLDQILIYRLDAENGKIPPNDVMPHAPVAPGSGPRHFAFHPNGRRFYVINELSNTVVAFDYDAEKGTLNEIQTVSSLPEGFSGTSHCAEVQVSPSGKFLYGSNRGHDSLAVFRIDEADGTLSAVDFTPTGGKNPRHFTIDPSGRFLLVANQETNNIVAFRIDEESGRLTPTGQVVEAPLPVCVKIRAS
jgi:6-phosphogluconolactonase